MRPPTPNSAPAESPALELHAVTHRFGSNIALREVTLQVRQHEALAVVGESGSGKTTLLRCFNRMIDPEGRVRVLGEDVTALDPIALRRRIGYVPQEGGLMPHWSVRRNAALVSRLRGDLDADTRAEAMLRAVGLAPETFADRRPSTLSGGQRQRVAIARALATEPAILLMDEPFSALDALTRADLHETFQQLRRRWPVTTILVTHDLAEAVKLADRIAVMYRGQLQQIDPPSALIAHPATNYVAALVAPLYSSAR